MYFVNESSGERVRHRMTGVGGWGTSCSVFVQLNEYGVDILVQAICTLRKK